MQEKQEKNIWNITLTERLTPNSTVAPLQPWWISNSWQLTNQHFLPAPLKIRFVWVCVRAVKRLSLKETEKSFLQTSTLSSGSSVLFRSSSHLWSGGSKQKQLQKLQPTTATLDKLQGNKQILNAVTFQLGVYGMLRFNRLFYLTLERFMNANMSDGLASLYILCLCVTFQETRLKCHVLRSQNIWEAACRSQKDSGWEAAGTNQSVWYNTTSYNNTSV